MMTTKEVGLALRAVMRVVIKSGSRRGEDRRCPESNDTVGGRAI